MVREKPLPPPPILRSVYDRVGMTLAMLGAGVLGMLLWYFSADFTLDFLRGTFPAFVRFFADHWMQWLVPIGISAGELFLWPEKEYRPRVWALRLALWSLFLGFDIVTTNFGVSPWIKSWTWNSWIQDSPQFAYRLIWETLVSLEIGLALAYLPEKIIRWVLADLWSMWIAPAWNWYKNKREQERRAAEMAA
ncbi:MAG TPA: hypothetical protein VFS21_29760 [Roseiflexaceae bacterium]|nr:hypothetical protein [Roseiflexaceae bacterium]